MEQNYKTTEVWYSHNGGGEMIEIYDPQTGMPLSIKDSKLVTTFKD